MAPKPTAAELLARREEMVAWALERWGIDEERAEESEVALSVIEEDDDDEERAVATA